DVHAGTLVQEGHMDRVLQHTVDLGLDPMTALQMMTINTAQHFGVDRDLGSLAPGRYADVVIAASLEKLKADVVISGGELLAENGKLLVELPPFAYPAEFKSSVKIGKPLRAPDFGLKAPKDSEEVTAHVIGVVENHALTHHLTARLKVAWGEVQPDI